jgi:hypothetical protein
MQAHLEEAHFLLELLEIYLDPAPAPRVRRVPSVAGNLHRRSPSGCATRRCADARTNGQQQERE